MASRNVQSKYAQRTRKHLDPVQVDDTPISSILVDENGNETIGDVPVGVAPETVGSSAPKSIARSGVSPTHATPRSQMRGNKNAERARMNYQKNVKQQEPEIDVYAPVEVDESLVQVARAMGLRATDIRELTSNPDAAQKFMEQVTGQRSKKDVYFVEGDVNIGDYTDNSSAYDIDDEYDDEYDDDIDDDYGMWDDSESTYTLNIPTDEADFTMIDEYGDIDEEDEWDDDFEDDEYLTEEDAEIAEIAELLAVMGINDWDDDFEDGYWEDDDTYLNAVPTTPISRPQMSDSVASYSKGKKGVAVNKQHNKTSPKKVKANNVYSMLFR